MSIVEACQDLPYDKAALHPKFSKALVTGGGFFGQDLLCELDRCNIIPFPYTETGKQVWNYIPQQMDVTDLDAIIRILSDPKNAGVDFDTTIHTAAKTDGGWCNAHPEEAVRVNVGGTENIYVASLAREVPYFVYCSSAAIFTESSRPDGHLFTEEETPDFTPTNVYPQTKWQAEQYLLKKMSSKAEPGILIVRFPMLTGAWQGTYQGSPRFCDYLREASDSGVPFVARKEIVTPINTKHAAEILVYLVQKGVTGIVNVTGGEPISKADLARGILENSGRDPSIVVEKEGPTINTSLDPKKMTSLITGNIKTPCARDSMVGLY